MSDRDSSPWVAVACGGTGGHLFPGLAVAEVLQQWGCEVALLISKKEVDQEAVKSAVDLRIVTLPAVALQNGRWSGFARGFWQSYRICRKSFHELRPRAVLAMGGFTSAPPVLAGKRGSAFTFLHESNSIPGRANRWLSPWVDGIFISFPGAAARLYNQTIRPVGTPVRSQFRSLDQTACRMALGLEPAKPVLLVMGGSQGATAINRLVQSAIPILSLAAPELQYLHLAGPDDVSRLKDTYIAHGRRAVVRPFLTEMELGLGAATVAVNRAGASSLAEIAAVRLPSLLVPYPYATDNHQYYNAKALADTGAAQLLEQNSATAESCARAVLELLKNATLRASMQAALTQWDAPNAAEEIAGSLFETLGLLKPERPAEEFAAGPMPGGMHKPWGGGAFRLSLTSGPSK